MTVQFVHIRNYEFIDVPMGIAWRPFARGGVTLAYIVDEQTKEATVGMAVCSGNDGYNKKIGRQIAEARLKNKPITVPADYIEDVVGCSLEGALYGNRLQIMAEKAELDHILHKALY